MSLPLKDFRLGITEAIDVWLDAEAVAFDTDKVAVAREILQAWARRKAHAFKVAQRRMSDPHDFAANESLSAGRGNAAGGESRPCAPGPARGLRAQAATAYVADSAERRSPAGQDSAPAPDESNRHSTASSARCAAPTHVPPQPDAALGSGAAQSDGGGAGCRTAQVRGPR